MKQLTSLGLLTWPILLSGALATYNWNQVPIYPLPGRVNNVCSTQQTAGWRFDNTTEGPVTQFDGMTLSGFTCRNDARRTKARSLDARTDPISRMLSGRATLDEADCPSISSPGQTFSIKTLQMSANQSDWINLIYTMPDGGTCRQRSWCTPTESSIVNTQCGGAVEVKIQGSCEFNLHRISFDCDHHASTSTAVTTTPRTRSSSTATSRDMSTTDMITTAGTSSQILTTSLTSASTQGTISSTSSSTASTMSESSSDVRSVTTNSRPSTTSSGGTTTFMATTRQSSKFSSSITPLCPSSADRASDTWLNWDSSHVATTGCDHSAPTALQTSPSSSSPTTTSTPSSLGTSEVPYPSVLPRCLRSWIEEESECDSNSDVDCFCPSSTTIALVHECISAWSDTGTEMLNAYTYLAGICVEYVDENPGLCTNVSATNASMLTTAVPSWAPWFSSAMVSSASPSHTSISALPSTTAHCGSMAGANSAAMQTITVPQVIFSTITALSVLGATTTPQVGLVPATVTAEHGPSTSTGSSFTPTVPSNGLSKTPSPSGGVNSTGALQTYAGVAGRNVGAVGSSLFLFWALMV